MNSISKGMKSVNTAILHSKGESKPNFLGKLNLSTLKFDIATFSERSKVFIKQPVLRRDGITPMVNPEMVKHLGNYFATFNPGVIKDEKGGIHLLIRSVRGESYPKPPFYSDLIYAHSKDGKTIDEGSMKVIVQPNKKFPMGFEDPRITKMEGDDRYHIICTGYDGKYPRMCHWTTKDLADKTKYNFEGPISPKKGLINGDDKDALLFPEKVNGKYMLFHRIGEDIQVILANNLRQLKNKNFWKNLIKDLDKNTILKNKPGTWQNKIGGGPPPIKTKDGWLTFYHGSNRPGEGREYDGGLALYDLKNPTKLIARAHDPIMKPETPYEKGGPVPGVVFPQGLFEDGDNLKVYYGCGDKNVGVAETKIYELLKYVKQFDADGNIMPKKQQTWPPAPYNN